MGLLVGYVAFGLTFTYHIATHGYYQLPAIPLAALCVGGLITWSLHAMRQRRLAKLWVSLSVAVVATLLAVHIPLQRRAPPGFPRGTPQGSDSPAVETHLLAEIGQRVHHTTRAVILDLGDGLAVQYYGSFSGVGWPTATDLLGERLPEGTTVAERLRDTMPLLGGPPRYFVITALSDFRDQPELVGFLNKHPA